MKKRIIPIIALSLIAVIALTTVIFAFVTANFKPELKEFSSISISGSEVNGGSSIYLDPSNSAIPENKEKFDKINQLLNDSFNESALNALFNGRLGAKAELIKKENVIKNITSSEELTKYLVFEYENKEDLLKVDYQGTEKSFDRVIIKIEEVKDANIQYVNLYLVEKDATYCSYYYQSYGNYYYLFEYVNSLIQED